MTAALPTLAATDVTVTTDQCGRPVVLLPDRWAALLVAASNAGWVDVPDMNYGESCEFEPGTIEHAAAHTILDVVAAAPPRALHASGCGPSDQQLARQGAFYGFLVGRSAWDAGQRWWAHPVPSPAHRELVCSASLHARRHRGGAVHWSG